jgi:hypothetical protein
MGISIMRPRVEDKYPYGDEGLADVCWDQVYAFDKIF